MLISAKAVGNANAEIVIWDCSNSRSVRPILFNDKANGAEMKRTVSDIHNMFRIRYNILRSRGMRADSFFRALFRAARLCTRIDVLRVRSPRELRNHGISLSFYRSVKPRRRELDF